MAQEDIPTSRIIQRTLADVDAMKRFIESAKNSPQPEFGIAEIVDEFDQRCRGWIKNMHMVLERLERRLGK